MIKNSTDSVYDPKQKDEKKWEIWNFLYEMCLGKNETRQTSIGSYVLPLDAWDSLNTINPDGSAWVEG